MEPTTIPTPTDAAADPPQAPHLYRIEAFSDLWVDACLRNSEGELKFLSVFGRDGSLMQFIASMELGVKEGGITRFTLVNGQGERHQVDVGHTDRLGKHSGRLPKQNLFGPLSQMWIYDKALQTVDQANRIGWVVHREADEAASRCASPLSTSLGERTWSLMKRLSPIPLMDAWREALVAWCHDKQAVMELGDARYPAIGPVRAQRVSISDHFVRHVSDSVRSGLLKA
jgi:hypothetical protein